jgi:mono/diheme cytochrome c family protein
MPGTAMPAWVHLPEADRWTLTDYVLQLNRDGWLERGMRSGYSKAEAEKFAAEMTGPGNAIPIPPEPPPTAEGLRQGRKYYLTVCAKCHGQNGEGKQDPTWRTSEGFPTWSRNLREGVFKGGREGQQLYLRFFTGLPGTPMPSGELPPEQVWRVVQYVQGLSDPSAQELAQVRAKEIGAARVEKLPSTPDDAAWAKVSTVHVPLMPLWWNEASIGAVRVKALHDGQHVAFLLEWTDSTYDVDVVRQRSFPDGAAVQFSTKSEPPLFAMGEAGQVVSIWHWKAAWQEDKRQFQDVGSAFPRMVAEPYYGSEKGWQSGPLEDPTYLPAARVRNLLASPHRTTVVEEANAVGFGTLTSQAPAKQNVQGASEWKKGVWRLQLVRVLKSADAEDIALLPGKSIPIAFAVWNGSAGDRNGQKSVSLWNTLRLE